MKNADEPMHPTEFYRDQPHQGLTKREYFAAIAMQAIITSDPNCNFTKEDIARYAVEQSDALLKELEK